MRLIVCGVRGSTPAPGPDFLRYGGNTSCVAVSHADEAPRLVLDGGTGLQRLSASFNGYAFHGTIVLGHLHWDHTHGLPFFQAGHQDDAEVRLYVPGQGKAPEQVLARAIGPPHFPVETTQFRGNWTVHSLEPGEYEMEGFRVLALEIPHKGGRTFGYRVSDDSASFAYLSDHSPIAYGPGPDGFGEYHENALRLAEGADLLIHDAQHLASEFTECAYLGHSAIEYPIGLARRAGAKRVLLYHHDPWRTDPQIDEIVRDHTDEPIPVEAAYEGQTIELP